MYMYMYIKINKKKSRYFSIDVCMLYYVFKFLLLIIDILQFIKMEEEKNIVLILQQFFIDVFQDKKFVISFCFVAL